MSAAPRALVWALALAFGLGVSVTAGDVDAQAKKPVPAKKGKWRGKGKKPPVEEEPKPEAAEKADAKPEADKESKLAATETPKKTGGGPTVVETKEQGEGVKTYKFGPVEVEGRLKSPQVMYFMRRMRAEFAAGALGHRSFLRELADTRRSPAVK